MANQAKSNTLTELRSSIDRLDSALMFLLAERTHAIVKVGILKAQQNIPLSYSEKREQDLQHTIEIASERKLSATFMENLFKRIYQRALVIMETQQNKSAMTENVDSLENLRESIYNLDISLCHILAERFNIVLKVGKYKQQQKMQPLVTNRWEQVLADKTKMAEQLGIDIDFIKDLFNMIHAESLRLQEEGL